MTRTHAPRPLAVALALLTGALLPAFAQAPLPAPDAPLPFDPKVKVGQLDNGLRYYVRENAKPENRIELRLAVRAGSVLEADDQQGLAHYLEHMAFNGTKNFAKQELVDFLESIGMGFGSHLNAYTGFDQTVYMLQVPTADREVLGKAFQILEDWIHGVTLDDEEIEKERGVIIEEWRGRRGAGQRIQDEQLPVLLHGSKYADRLVIGKREVLDNFDFDRMRAFYRDWYRPDLMGIIAVGTLPVDELEKMIVEQFGKIPKPEGKPPRPDFPVPDHEETLAAIVTDPEATASSVELWFKHPGSQMRTHGDYRRSILESLFFSMMNQRLAELTQRADPPYLAAQAVNMNFVPTRKFVGFAARVREGEHRSGMEAVLTEVERVRRHGFTAGELERRRINMLRSIDQGYRERDKTRSRSYASRYVEAALKGDVSVGIEKARELYNALLPGITLAEVNALAAGWVTAENRVITADGPEKDGVRMPGPEELVALFDEIGKRDIEPYAEDLGDTPLVEKWPAPAAIVKRETRDDVGVTTWTLSNGARVMLKATDFKADEIRFSAWSEGGSSLAEDENYLSASRASGMALIGGVGAYSLIDLQKKLAGKVVSVSPYVGTHHEGFSGSCSPQDLETLFDLMTAYRTAPRRDEEAYASFQKRQIAALENRLARPEAVYGDEITRIMTRDHPRRRPLTPERVPEIELDPALAFYKERFANPGGFTYLFVGNLDPATLEPLVLRHLGGGEADTETWRDEGIRRPSGAIEKTVRKGLEPKAMVRMSWWGEFDWGYPNRHALQSMASVLNIKLRERIREDLGGTYSIGAYAGTQRIPVPEYQLNVAFGCNPGDVDKLVAAVEEEIAALQKAPVEDLYVTKIKEQQLRQREVQLKENGFWLSNLSFYAQNGEDPSTLLQLPAFANALTPDKIQAVAKQYFSTGNRAKFVLLPEETEEK